MSDYFLSKIVAFTISILGYLFIILFPFGHNFKCQENYKLEKQLIENLNNNNQKLNIKILALENQYSKKVDIINSEILIVQNAINQLNKNVKKLASKKSKIQSSIDEFDVTTGHEVAYDILKNQIFLDVTKKGLKKFKSFKKHLTNSNKINVDDTLLITTENNYWYNENNEGRLISLNVLELNEKQIKKLNYLKNKEFLKSTFNSLKLEIITGINEDYFVLLSKLDSIQNIKNSILQEKEILKKKLKNSRREIHILEKKLSTEKFDLNVEIKKNKIKIQDIEKKIEKEEKKRLISLKYPVVNFNGVDISKSTLAEEYFQNGEAIREARTPREWERFINNEIPAFKKFIGNNIDSFPTNKEYFYNYYAVIDKREIAPLGFHKINIVEAQAINGTNIFEANKYYENCNEDGCEKGFYKPEGFKFCDRCYSWTEDQRKYNICPDCNNMKMRYIKSKKKIKHEKCGGKGKVLKSSCEKFGSYIVNLNSINNSKFRFFEEPIVDTECASKWIPSFMYLIVDDFGITSPKLKSHYNGDFSDIFYSNKYTGVRGHYGEEPEKYSEFSILICKNNEKRTDVKGKKIGNLCLMKDFLNVTTFRNGDKIKYIEDNIEWEMALLKGIPAYCYYNNDKSTKACIYNKHAWYDERGLIPLGWRSPTCFDFIHLKASIGYDFHFHNLISPLKDPKGYRDDGGFFHDLKFGDLKYCSDITSEWNFQFGNYDLNYSLISFSPTPPDENNYSPKTPGRENDCDRQSSSRQSGYVMCVRDMLFEKKKNNKLTQDIKKTGTPKYLYEINGKVKYKFGKIGISKRGISSNLEGKWGYYENISDYYVLYNSDGKDILDDLFLSDFEDLFDSNNEIRMIGLKVLRACDSVFWFTDSKITWEKSGGSSIYGIIIKNNSKFENYFEYTSCEIRSFGSNYSRKNINKGKLKKNSELGYTTYDRQKISNSNEFTGPSNLIFHFDSFDCDYKDNPIDNFYIKSGDYIFKKLGWENNIKNKFWGYNEEKDLEKIYNFFNEY